MAQVLISVRSSLVMFFFQDCEKLTNKWENRGFRNWCHKTITLTIFFKIFNSNSQ